MRVTLRNTTRIVELTTSDGATIPARVWEGHTDSGIPVIAFIPRIAAEQTQDLTEFERDLTDMSPPSPDVAAWPARMLID